MKTVRFTYRIRLGTAGYRCSEPGDHSGEYVKAEVGRKLLSLVRELKESGTGGDVNYKRWDRAVAEAETLLDELEDDQ